MLFLCSIFGQNMDNLINLCDAGSCIVGRAPWPVTVVLRLVSPGAKQVGRPEEHRHLRQSTQSWSSSNGWVLNLGMWIFFAEVQGGCSNHSICLFVLSKGVSGIILFPCDFRWSFRGGVSVNGRFPGGWLYKHTFWGILGSGRECP